MTTRDACESSPYDAIAPSSYVTSGSSRAELLLSLHLCRTPSPKHDPRSTILPTSANFSKLLTFSPTKAGKKADTSCRTRKLRFNVRFLSGRFSRLTVTRASRDVTSRIRSHRTRVRGSTGDHCNGRAIVVATVATERNVSTKRVFKPMYLPMYLYRQSCGAIVIISRVDSRVCRVKGY